MQARRHGPNTAPPPPPPPPPPSPPPSRVALQLYERFRPGQKPPPELGPSRDYNVDLVPKFIMVGGLGWRGRAGCVCV